MTKEENLITYYKIDFDLKQHGNYSQEELNYMIPYEKEIFLNMLIEKIRKENELRRQARASHQG